MTLGETIRSIRSAKGMSQGDLADALDVSRQSVSKWETDASVPELDKLMKLCDLFGVTMDELVRGVKPELPEKIRKKVRRPLPKRSRRNQHRRHRAKHLRKSPPDSTSPESSCCAHPP